MYNRSSMQSDDQNNNDSDYSPYSTSTKKKKKQRKSLSPPKQTKKRKYRDFDGNLNHKSSNNSIQIVSVTKTHQLPPPKKRHKITKRSSKKPVLSSTPTEPNSHVTITFANINGTIDAIILPKQNVLAMTSDVLLENKGKLSIKTSDPIQNDITPQIPIDIKVLTTPNIKTIHPRNSFRMGTSLFYCSDEERLFWSFPLRNTRRVSCQHYCCAVEKIVTRSVGIHSNKCNGNHSSTTPCIYAVCNGKPPKGIIPAKLFANYQYFQHSAKTDLLVPKDPNDTKFKKVENTPNNSTMYSNIKIIAHNKHPPNINSSGPPPLAPINDDISTTNSYQTFKNKYNSKPPIKTEILKQEYKIKNEPFIDNASTSSSVTTSNNKRRRQQTQNGDPAPFVQNVQIDLKALSEKKQKLHHNASSMTSSSSIGTEGESHDYSALLLHSTSSCVRDAAENERNIDINCQDDIDINNEMDIDIEMRNNMNMRQQIIPKMRRRSDRNNYNKQYIQLLMNGEFDKVISILSPLIPPQDQPGYPTGKKKRKNNIQQPDIINGDDEGYKKLNNERRLLMATALYYRDNVSNGQNDTSNALHFCNLITSECNEGDIGFYEARKIRGLIHKKLRNYKAACHDFEFICYNNPYHKTWRDKLYSMAGKNDFLENKIISPKTTQSHHIGYNRHDIISSHHRPPPPRHTLHQQGKPNQYYHHNRINPHQQRRLNEIITTHHHNNINLFQNNNYYQPPPIPPIPPNQSVSVANNILGGFNNPMLSGDTFDNDMLNNMIHNALNRPIQQQIPIQMNNNNISNPNAPIIYIPPIMDRNAARDKSRSNSRNNSGRNTPTTNNRNNNIAKANELNVNLQDFHAPNASQENNRNTPPTPTNTKPPSSGQSTRSNTAMIDPALLDINYSDLQQPNGFPERSQSNTSFEGLIRLAHAATSEYEKKNGNQQNKGKDDDVCDNPQDLLSGLEEFTAIKRKTTREELLGDIGNDNDEISQYIGNGAIGSNQNSSNDVISINSNLYPNISPLNKTVSKTPEPLDRIRSDCLVRTSSQ